MADYIGQTEVFNMAGEDWPAYIERLRHYLVINEIPSGKYVASC